MQHEALECVVLEEQIEALHIVLGAESHCGKRLRLAAREERRAVNARQQADFTSDLANLVERAGIRTAALVDNVLAEDALMETFDGASSELAFLFFFLGNGCDDFLLDCRNAFAAFEFGILRRVERFVQALRRISIRSAWRGLHRMPEA